MQPIAPATIGQSSPFPPPVARAAFTATVAHNCLHGLVPVDPYACLQRAGSGVGSSCDSADRALGRVRVEPEQEGGSSDAQTQRPCRLSTGVGSSRSYQGQGGGGSTVQSVSGPVCSPK